MRRRLVREGFDLGASRSPVVPVYVPDIERLSGSARTSSTKASSPYRSCTPRSGSTRAASASIVNSHHTREQIDRTVEALGSYGRALGVIPERRASIAPSVMPRATQRPSRRPSMFPRGTDSMAPPSV